MYKKAPRIGRNCLSISPSGQATWVANPLAEDLYLFVARFAKLVLIFVGTALVGAYAIEHVRMFTASTLGYETEYFKGIARNAFRKDHPGYDEELAKHSSFEEFKESEYFQEFVDELNSDRRKIEFSAIAFVGLCFVLGLILFKRLYPNHVYLSWIALSVCLWFMRYWLIYLVALRYGILCDEFAVFQLVANVSPWLQLKLTVVILSLAGLFVVSRLPRKKWLEVILVCAVGGVVSGLIWIYKAHWLF